MCRVCGALWLEQALLDTEKQPALNTVYLPREIIYRC